jgi:pimeloyl-ACP methyl ester carboxylesterase
LAVTNYQEKKFASKTIEVNYAEGPNNGPPLLFIHGLGGRWQVWTSIMDELADRWHIYSIDLRGHGDSGRVPGGYGFADYSTEVIDFLQNVIGQPTFIVGHSLGAITAVGTCAKASQLVAAAVLEDPPLYIEPEPYFQGSLDLRNKNLSIEDTAKELRKDDKDSSGEQLIFNATSLTKCDPEIWARLIEIVENDPWDPDAVLSRATSPILLLRGNPELYSALTESKAAQAAKMLSDGKVVQWLDVGHGMHSPQPERFIKEVSEFFDEVISAT